MNDVIEGEGEYDFGEEGGKYVGELSGGLRNGFGTYTYPTGDINEGIWKNDLQHGPGKIIYKNGDFYYDCR